MNTRAMQGSIRTKCVGWSVATLAGLVGWASATITITPTYVDGGGETWSIARKAVFQQAINDWQDVLEAPAAEGSVTINVTVDFASAGEGGYLGQWQAGASVPVGGSIRPWLNSSHTIHFNADLMDTGLSNYLWWDSSPTDGSDQPFVAWDALSVARHEIGHMLGFSSGLYRDNHGLPSQVLVWDQYITPDGGEATFDQGGLNIALDSNSNRGHLKDADGTAGDLMVPAMPNNQRRDISSTNAEMLSLAYDYVVIPEPGVAGLLVATIIFGIGRRRRLA